jgi:hypothetical protein
LDVKTVELAENEAIIGVAAKLVKFEGRQLQTAYSDWQFRIGKRI